VKKLTKLGVLAVTAAAALTMSMMGCATAAPAMYERGDYAEYSPLAVQNIEGGPEEILTTAERERREKAANRQSSSLLGALKDAAVTAIVDAISVDLDEEAIAREGETMILAAYEKAGISLVDTATLKNAPSYSRWQGVRSSGVVVGGAAAQNNKVLPQLMQEIGAKGFTSAVFYIEIADTNKLSEAFQVYPKVTLRVYMRDAQYKELITPITFTPRITAAPAKETSPTAAIDDKYVLTERVVGVMGQYDQEEFTALTLKAMQMCADQFVDYIEKGKTDFPGTYKGKK
jgi:hypothetical protein